MPAFGDRDQVLEVAQGQTGERQDLPPYGSPITMGNGYRSDKINLFPLSRLRGQLGGAAAGVRRDDHEEDARCS
jgi:hypothetical protein